MSFSLKLSLTFTSLFRTFLAPRTTSKISILVFGFSVVASMILKSGWKLVWHLEDNWIEIDLLLGLFLRQNEIHNNKKSFNNSKEGLALPRTILAHTTCATFSDQKKYFCLYFSSLYFISLFHYCVFSRSLLPSETYNDRSNYQWHALGREEQAKYYELARRERQLHMQMYPDWSSRTNATRGKKRKRKQEPNDGGINN